MEKSHEELIYSTPEEKELFNYWTNGLPTRNGVNGDGLDKFGTPIPFGSEAHIIKYFKKTIDIVKPKSILEIGFNYGAGSALLLNLSDAYVCSCDISEKDETINAVKVLKRKFSDRFDFYFRKDLPDRKFDLVFIDGEHTELAAEKDIRLATRMKIPYILFDDCYQRYGWVMKAIDRFMGLSLVEDMDNLRLYKNFV